MVDRTGVGFGGATKAQRERGSWFTQDCGTFGLLQTPFLGLDPQWQQRMLFCTQVTAVFTSFWFFFR